MRKTYVIFTGTIAGMGGAQLYVSNKASYLESQGWQVRIFSDRDAPILIPALEAHRDGIFPELHCWPQLLRRRDVERTLEMFERMQTLPIKYFDTRTHGDIMSYYTNDTDTLRQMLSQSLPNLFASLLSMIAVFASMLHLSIWLTLVTMAFTCIILLVMKKIAGMSGKYFVAQQKSLGDVNGYIEEMINGLKVVKVFCHEEKAQEVFDGKNEELCENMTKANILANIVMPLMGSLGYVLYVIIAIVGGFMGIAGVTNLSVGGEPVVTLGTIASFLILSRNFINPIAQVSQQMNAVIMAMANTAAVITGIMIMTAAVIAADK